MGRADTYGISTLRKAPPRVKRNRVPFFLKQKPFGGKRRSLKSAGLRAPDAVSHARWPAGNTLPPPRDPSVWGKGEESLIKDLGLHPPLPVHHRTLSPLWSFQTPTEERHSRLCPLLIHLPRFLPGLFGEVL